MERGGHQAGKKTKKTKKKTGEQLLEAAMRLSVFSYKPTPRAVLLCKRFLGRPTW